MRTDQEQPLNDFVQRHLLQSMISYVVAKMAVTLQQHTVLRRIARSRSELRGQPRIQARLLPRVERLVSRNFLLHHISAVLHIHRLVRALVRRPCFLQERLRNLLGTLIAFG